MTGPEGSEEEPAAPPGRDDPVALPLGFEEALQALLEVDPDDPPATDDGEGRDDG